METENVSEVASTGAADRQQAGTSLLDQAGEALNDNPVYRHTPEPVKQGLQTLYDKLLGGGEVAPQPASSSAPAAAAQQTPAFPPASQAAAAAAFPARAAKPAPDPNQAKHAAYIGAYTMQDAPRQLDDAQLATYFGVSPSVIAAIPDAFHRRWQYQTNQEALGKAPALCQAITTDPRMGQQLGREIPRMASIENMLRFKPGPRPRPEWMRNSNNMSEEELRAVASQMALPQYDHPILGTLEAMLSEGTGTFLGSPAGLFGGAMGLLAKATSIYPDGSEEAKNAGIDPAKFMSDAADLFTYHPRTRWGQESVEKINKALGYIPNLAGHAVADATTHWGMSTETSARAAALAESTTGIVPWLLGARAVRGKQGHAPVADAAINAPEADSAPQTRQVQGHAAPEHAASVQTAEAETHSHKLKERSDIEGADAAMQEYLNLYRMARTAGNAPLRHSDGALYEKTVRQGARDAGDPVFYLHPDDLKKIGIPREILQALEPDQVMLAQDGSLAIPRHLAALHPELMEAVTPFARASRNAPNAIEALAMARDRAEESISANDGALNEAQTSPAEVKAVEQKPDEPDRADERVEDTVTEVPDRHPLLDEEQWAKYQKELQGMSPGNRAIAGRFADKLRDYDAAVAEYAQLQGSQGGKVLNTDLARELSPDYLKDRTKSEVVQRLASALVRRMYADRLAATKEPMVILSAGGPGAGKSTVLEGYPRLVNNADIVYDTTMSHYPSAKGMIEQALQANGSVEVVLVIREPTDALLNGVIRRAMEEEKLHGSGRTVTLDYFLSAQPAAIRNVFRLAEEYKGDADVAFRFVDNTHGKDDIREVSLEQAKKIEFQQVEERASEILEQEYRDGRISKKTYTGIKFGKDVP